MTEMVVIEDVGPDEFVSHPSDRQWPRWWMRAFFAQLERVPNVMAACNAARIGQSTVYDWQQRLPEFAAAVTEAKQIATDGLEDLCYRTAMEGVLTRKVVRKLGPDGALIEETVTETLERYHPMAMFLLKANDEKYRFAERREISGPDGGPIELTAVTEIDRRIAELTATQARRAAELEAPVPEE